MAKGNRGGKRTKSASNQNYTPQQQQKINNMTKSLAKRSGATQPTFTIQQDGVVRYEYTMTRTVNVVHNSKMQSADKNDVYKRTEICTGTIGKDGLIKKDKTQVNDILVKKGR